MKTYEDHLIQREKVSRKPCFDFKKIYSFFESINVYGCPWKADCAFYEPLLMSVSGHFVMSINVYGRPWKAYNAVEDTLGRHYVPF